MDIKELLTQGLFTQPKEQPAVNRGRPLVGLELLASEGMRASEGAASVFTDVGSGLRRRLSDTLQERGYDINLLTQEEKLGRELQQLNLETPEGLTRLAEIQRMTGDLEGSLQTLGTLRQAEAQGEQRSAMKKYVVDTYGSQYGDLVDTGVIKDLGDLKTFIDKKPKKGGDPSKSDVKEIEMLLKTAGSEAKGGEMFGFFGTDWDEAWKDLSVNKKRDIATQIAEEVDRLVNDDGIDSSVAKRMAIEKMYTANLTEKGLLEFGESKLLSTEEREEQEVQDVRDAANKLLNNPLYSSNPPE
jgi:hypothetical protein